MVRETLTAGTLVQVMALLSSRRTRHLMSQSLHVQAKPPSYTYDAGHGRVSAEPGA